MEVSFIDTIRGRPKLCYEGHFFIKDKDGANDKIIWKCEKTGMCKARIHTLENKVVKSLNEHTHSAQPCFFFPKLLVVFCMFQLMQSLIRKVGECGLKKLYMEDENVTMHIRMIGALCYVPPSDVIDTFETLCEESPK